VLNRAAERKVLAIQKVKILVKESINLKEIKGANFKGRAEFILFLTYQAKTEGRTG